MLAGQLLRFQERLVQLVDFLGLALRLGTRHAKRLGLRGGHLCFFFQARRFDFLRRRAKVALDFSFLFQRNFLPENILVFRVGLRKIIEAEPLREFQFAAALGVALHQQINAPLDFRRRALPAASEILVVFNLELADVALELAQLLVNGRHARRKPPNLHARSTSESRQPEERAAMCIRHRCRPPGLPGAPHCAEMFEWMPGSNARFRASKRNCCGKFLRLMNCCCSRGWRRFRIAWTAAYLWKWRARCWRIFARASPVIRIGARWRSTRARWKSSSPLPWNEFFRVRCSR